MINLFFDSLTSIVGFLCLFEVIDVWPWSMVASVGFRVCQLCILPFSFDAERIEFEGNLKQMGKELDELNERIKIEKDPINRARLNKELQQIENCIADEKSNWCLRRIEVRNRCMSLMGFLLGTLMFASLLFPPALIPLSVALCITLAGAAVCVSVSLLTTYLQTQVVLERHDFNEKMTQKQLQKCLTEFKEYPGDQKNSDDMKALYLEIKQLASRSALQKRLYAHQQA